MKGGNQYNKNDKPQKTLLSKRKNIQKPAPRNWSKPQGLLNL